MDNDLADQGNKVIERATPRKPVFLKNLLRNVRVYFFQFFMLFLAVTAGFFAENYREESGERKQSREYARSMVGDLIRDTGNMRYQIFRLKKAVNIITDLASYTRDKQVNQLNNLDMYRLTSITWNPPFRWSRATIEQIKSSGSLRYFTNDSIVYYISQYDALTLHLDQDNLEDQQRYLQAMEKRVQVVDLNYAEDFLAHLSSNPDSLMQTPAYADWKSNKPLLTNDISKVKLMINGYLVAKEHAISRTDELSELVHDQNRLILLLKREYNLQ